MIYYYKDFTVYELLRSMSFSENGQKPISIPQTFYIVSKNDMDSMYFFTDSLKLYKVVPKSEKDSIFFKNTMLFKTAELDTTKYKLYRMFANKRKCFLYFNGVSKVDSAPLVRIIIKSSRKKLSIRHKIFPIIDNFIGMRTYNETIMKYSKSSDYKVYFSFEVDKYRPAPEKWKFISNFLDSAVANKFKNQGPIKNSKYYP